MGIHNCKNVTRRKKKQIKIYSQSMNLQNFQNCLDLRIVKMKLESFVNYGNRKLEENN